MARGDPRAPRSCWAGACQGILGGLLERYAWRKTSAAGGGLRDSPPPGYASRAAAGRAGAPEKKSHPVLGQHTGPWGGSTDSLCLGGERGGEPGWERLRKLPKSLAKGKIL